MNRVLRILSAAATASAVVGGGAFALNGAAADPGRGAAVVTQGTLTDLQPAVADPVDGATAQLTVARRDDASTFSLRVHGVDRSQVGRRFGAHLHVGPCVAGNGAAAGPHYNTDVLAGDPTPTVDRSTEVWLDFEVTGGGNGTAVAHVPFVPEPGIRSVVIHRDPTDSAGAAGPRLACIPVDLR